MNRSLARFVDEEDAKGVDKSNCRPNDPPSKGEHFAAVQALHMPSNFRPLFFLDDFIEASLTMISLAIDRRTPLSSVAGANWAHRELIFRNVFFALLTYMHFFLMDDNGLGCGRVALLFIGFVLLCLLTFIFFLFLFFVFSKQRVQGAVEHLRQFNQRRDVRLVFIILPFADGLERGVQMIRKLLLPNSFFDFETI